MNEVKAFTAKNGWLSGAAILRDWAAILALAALSIRVDHWAFYILAVWLIGFFQFALSEAMLHEAAHYNLFRSRRLNHLMELFYGLPFFCTVKQYQPEHQIHHIRLGGDGDELIDDYRRLGLYKEKLNVTWIWLVKPILGFGCYYASIVSLRPWRQGAKIAGFWAAAAVLFYYLGMLHVLVLYWFVPLLWSNYSFVYWSEIENHFNTRSGTRTNVSALYNLIAHNSGYHAVHHRYPAIPWFNLARAHAALSAPSADGAKGADGAHGSDTGDFGDVSQGFLDTCRQLRRRVPDGRLPAFLPRARADAAGGPSGEISVECAP